jgi:hypothetical protein
MTQLTGMTFSQQTIRLDGVAYRNCRFENCRIVFGGALPTALQDNQFQNCTWGFDGPAATTMQFLAALHAQGGDARTLVEGTWNALKGEAVPAAEVVAASAAESKPAVATH